jgi:pentatricopeptide repeat protein
LTVVVSNLNASAGLETEAMIPLLREALKTSQDSQELATIRALFALYSYKAIMNEPHLYNDNDLESVFALSSDLVMSGTGTWQAALGYVVQTAVKGLDGKKEEAIERASEALAKIDFDMLEKNNDPAWRAVRKYFGDRPYVLREYLKSNIINALCDSSRSDEAEKLWKSMTESPFKRSMARRIQLEYEMKENAKWKRNGNIKDVRCSFDQTQVLLAGVLDELLPSGEWTSLSMPARLEVVARYATNAPVVATANVLLARHMLDRLSDEAVAGGGVVKVPNRLYRLCRVASEMPPENWQSALSAWIVASAMLLEGKTADARAVAESALKKTDFESLEKLEDKAWLAARKTLGKSPFVLRESLNSVLELSQMKVEPEVMRQPVAAEIPVN